jgi:RNA polymerase sigma-70 factor (ECF subfamily)
VVDNPANQDAFRRELEPYHRELLAHCYRMLGSLHDAEDAYQETLVRAWRHRDRFAGRSSLRSWLHRIATNACLDAIGDRKARTMPELVGPASSPDAQLPDADGDIAWLEPYPDAWISEAALGPEARYSARESITIAFTVALQLLPPRQRAVLLVRDVLGLSADEAADALGMSVAAITSALERARAALDERAKSDPVSDASPGILDLLGRYLRAWESGDTSALLTVLRDDAILSMPPIPLWLAGAPAIAAFYDHALRPMGPIRVVAAHANATIAVGNYVDHAFRGLSVLAVRGGRIAAIYSFLAIEPTAYGLPSRLGTAT